MKTTWWRRAENGRAGFTAVLSLAICTSTCAPEERVPFVVSTEGVTIVGLTVTTGSQSFEASVAEVDAGFFLPDAAAILGRLFRESDHGESARPATVLTHAFWEQLGGTPASVGSTLNIGGSPYTVIGVTPSGFAEPEGVDLWVAR